MPVEISNSIDGSYEEVLPGATNAGWFMKKAFNMSFLPASCTPFLSLILFSIVGESDCVSSWTISSTTSIVLTPVLLTRHTSIYKTLSTSRAPFYLFEISQNRLSNADAKILF